MIISTRGRYALRVIIDLAEHSASDYVAMREIAGRQEISLKYLEKILPALVSGGLIQGIHGKGGGYRLTRPPEEITVGQILRLTEARSFDSMASINPTKISSYSFLPSSPDKYRSAAPTLPPDMAAASSASP